MAKKTGTQESAAAPKAVQWLVEVSGADTVYADLHLRRARELLSSVLTLAQYNALKGIQRDIDEAVKQSKVATMSQDWRRVESLAGRVDELRRSAQEKAAVSALGAKVYDAYGVSVARIRFPAGVRPGPCRTPRRSRRHVEETRRRRRAARNVL
jgi:hypothetical protein